MKVVTRSSNHQKILNVRQVINVSFTIVQSVMSEVGIIMETKEGKIVELGKGTIIPVEVHEVKCPKCGEWVKVMKNVKR